MTVGRIGQFFEKINPFAQPKGVSSPSVIERLAKDRIEESQSIFQYTKAHNIKQLEDKPKTNKWLSKALVFFLYAGILAGIIGVGGLLPHIGINPNLGIIGISQNVSIGLMALGLFTTLSLTGLRIAANKKGKAQEYYKDFEAKRSNWFIDSNLNDLIGALVFICLAMTFVHASWMTTLQGCLNYPCGALLIFSGLYQLGESIKDLKNAKQVGDKEKVLRQWVNIFNSLLIISLGATTLFGLMNNPLVISANFINGFLSFAIAAYLLKKSSLSTLKDINKVDENDPDSIMNYLKNTLTLNEKEIIKIEGDINSKLKTKKDILNWIDQNLNSWETKQKAKWIKIKKHLEDSQELELEKISQEEFQKLIIRDEIKKELEKKFEDFRSLVDEQTYKPTLHAVENASDISEDDLKKLFKNIKNQVKCKMHAEFAKLFMYAGFMLVPGLNMAQALNVHVYDIGMAVLSSLSLGINLTPRFRNIPPAMTKKALDINEKKDPNYLEKIHLPLTKDQAEKYSAIARDYVLHQQTA